MPVIDEFRNQIFLEDIGGRGKAEFTVSGIVDDPDVKGRFKSDSVEVYDLISKDFMGIMDIRHFFTNPEGEVEIFSGAFDYNGMEGDQLHTCLRVEPDRVFIDDAMASIPPFELHGTGRLDIEPDSVLLTFSKLTAEIDSEVISIDKETVASFSDSGINLLALELSDKSDRLSATGSYQYNGTIGFNLEYDSLRVGSWLPYFYDGPNIEGLLAGNGTISGTLANPIFLFDLSIANATIEKQPVGELTGQLSYQDSILYFEHFFLEGENNASTLQGYVPLDLALEQKDSRVLEEKPIGIDLSISGTNFNLIEVFFEDIEWLKGAFKVEVGVSGTPSKLQLDGAISVDDCSCKLYYIENPLEKIRFVGEFDGHRLTITSLNGVISQRHNEGVFDVSGSIDLSELTKPNYDLVIRGSNIPIKYDLGDIELLIDDIDLTVQESDPPVVTGDVDIAQFVYKEPFFEDVELDALEAADTVESFNYNIHVTIPQNMWIKNEDADVELKGDLILLKEERLKNFLGTLETVRGKFYLMSLNRTFTIQPGGTIVFENIEEFNPHIDIRMTTMVRDSTGVRDVCMQLTRTLKDPNIDVCPGSDLTIDEVLVLLNPIGIDLFESEPSDTGEVGRRSSIGDRLTVGATGIAVSQVSRIISRRLGVETFEINASSFGRNFNPLKTELTIGFYTTPRLYIYGTGQISFGKTEELGFDYRLSRHVFISGNRDRDNLFHLNLNLNWEFE